MDDLEKKLKELKNEIKPSVKNNPAEIYSKFVSMNQKEEKNQKKLFGNLNLMMKYVVSVLLIVCITVASISILLHKGNKNYTFIYNEESKGNYLPADNSIKQVTSFEELKMIIDNSSSTSSNITDGLIEPGFKEEDFEFNEGLDSDMGVVTGTPSYTMGSIDIAIDTDRDYSTNNQVEGVEEADIVKVNGDYIYYIPRPNDSFYNLYYSSGSLPVDNVVYILKARMRTVDVTHKFVYEASRVLVEEDEEAKVYDCSYTIPQDLYITDKFLIVSAITYKWTNIEYYSKVEINDEEVKLTRTLNRNRNDYSEYFIYDINTYELVTSIKTAGNNVSTRLIDNELYIINNYVDYENNKDAYIPHWYFGDTLITPSIGRFYYCAGIGTNVKSYVVIYKISLGQTIEVDDFYFLTPSINNVYMNENSIYLIRNYSSKTEVKEKVSTNWPTAKVVIINVEDEIVPDGVIEVKGRINDKYWIDENNGYLRVATTGTKYVSKVIAGKYLINSYSEVFNSITIFKKDKDGLWKEVSSITEGIGEPGETMRSARFNGDVVTVVTFRNTDPLYYIDLTDPYNPKITSELKVTGYTVYQHPYKDKYVIGIGYEATESGATIGYKIALFDVSNKANIKQVGNALVFSNSEYKAPSVLSNTKAIMLDLTNNLFGFSMMSYEKLSDRYTYEDGTTSYRKYVSNYFVFEIDENSENPITIKLREEQIASSANYVSDSELRRMVFIDDKYYLLTNEKVFVYNYKLEKIKTVSLN